jgi:hypothetical protein
VATGVSRFRLYVAAVLAFVSETICTKVYER